MTTERRRTRVLVAALVGLALGLSATTASSDPTQAKTPVTLAEVASRVDGAALPNVVELLRSDVESEIAAIDWDKTGLRNKTKKYTVSAAVVRLDSKREADGLKATCTVSATLREAKTGTLLAIVEGRAQAEEAPSAGARAQRGALAGAARGAVTALPEAIRRTQ